MQEDLKFARSGTPPARRSSVVWLAYSLRVAQLLGSAGFLAAALHWLTVSRDSKLLVLNFGVGCLVLGIVSTLALRWVKLKYPQTAAKGIHSAEERWNTPLNEKGVQIGILVFIILLGAILLWLLR